MGSTTSLRLELQRELESIEEQFNADTAKLKAISKRFEEELQEGLERDGGNTAMNITWVLGMPTGDEEGQYLTVDHGGTNWRTCIVTPRGRGRETTVDQDLTELPDDIKTSTGEQL